MPKERTDAETSRALRSALRKRYPAPTWVLMEEVRDRAGYYAKRSADAIAMATWESRGMELHGFELKASRADWIRERDNPEKAEPIAKFVDRWWLVAASADLVKDGELPPTWGLYVLDKRDGLRIVTQAEKRTPAPITRGFLAALLKRAMGAVEGFVHPDDVAAAVEKKLAEKEATRLAHAPYEEQQRVSELDRHRKLVKALGVRFDRYRGEGDIPNIAKAYALVTSLEYNVGIREALQRDLNGHERAATCAREAIAELESAARVESTKDLMKKLDEHVAAGGLDPLKDPAVLERLRNA